MAGKVPDLPATHDASGSAPAPTDALEDASAFRTRDRRRSALQRPLERSIPLPAANLANAVVWLEADGRTDRTPRLAAVDPGR